MEPEEFLEHFRAAIGEVEQQYYVGERTFCYELYHQLRIRTDEAIRNAPANLVFHTENTKRVLGRDEAQAMGLAPLRKRRSPDLILHEYGTGDFQIAAVEVKARGVYWKPFRNDLVKLTEMIEALNFRVAVFLCINRELTSLRRFIIRNRERFNNISAQIVIMAKNGADQPLEYTDFGNLHRENDED
ncbi:MAG: hypothetical protein IPM63_13425 [Acidobacteriota bacterium]|nr:MAG: hypothetical protein IPM63_13425 [Acidobacteriota bacterium]